METMVVFEALTDYGRPVWAWCKSDGGVGFVEIGFTETDGITPLVEPGDNPPKLRKMLFSFPTGVVEVTGAVAVIE